MDEYGRPMQTCQKGRDKNTGDVVWRTTCSKCYKGNMKVDMEDRPGEGRGEKAKKRARRPMRPEVAEFFDLREEFSLPLKAGRVVLIHQTRDTWDRAQLISRAAHETTRPTRLEGRFNQRAVEEAAGERWRIRWLDTNMGAQCAEQIYTFVADEEQKDDADVRAEWRFERDECGGSAIRSHRRIKHPCEEGGGGSMETCDTHLSLGACKAAASSGRDMLLHELRTWMGGLERIGDAEQLVALLVRNEVNLWNLGSFTVDELLELGVGEDVACELLSQFQCHATTTTRPCANSADAASALLPGGLY
jgi:hypothetical protein